jgi:hypothetical protein
MAFDAPGPVALAGVARSGRWTLEASSAHAEALVVPGARGGRLTPALIEGRGAKDRLVTATRGDVDRARARTVRIRPRDPGPDGKPRRAGFELDGEAFARVAPKGKRPVELETECARGELDLEQRQEDALRELHAGPQVRATFFPPRSPEPAKAPADELDFDGATRTLRVRGDPARVQHGKQTATGRELEYELDDR